uniref:grasp-with-spasm system SPASM domain peptide maturase n=1 Tax=Fulvivirga sp. TaxID=1931237 RepID=UPI0040497DE8
MKYFKLYSNCIAVRGAYKSIICDLQRREIYNISLDLYEILNQAKSTPFKEILSEYEDEDIKVIMNWIKNLEDMEVGFYCDDPIRFPDLSLEFETPEKINNCIIEYGIESNFDWEYICKELASVGCKFLEIRIRKLIQIDELENILTLIKLTNIKGVEIILPFQSTAFTKKLEWMMLHHQRIGRIVVHSIDLDENILESSEKRLYQIIQNIDSNHCCGNIDKKYFVPNVSLFTESLKFNNCLNKKISIAENGAIKNCPSMKDSYGELGQVSLESVLDIQGFKATWGIHKDLISVCKDCEYRYICSDCRAYIIDSNDPYSKPLKCGYDPYTGIWSKWEEDKSKMKVFKDYVEKESNY